MLQIKQRNQIEVSILIQLKKKHQFEEGKLLLTVFPAQAQVSAGGITAAPGATTTGEGEAVSGASTAP